jgi:hypothetical protein
MAQHPPANPQHQGRVPPDQNGEGVLLLLPGKVFQELAVVPSLGLGSDNRAAKLLQKCPPVLLAHGFLAAAGGDVSV